MLISGLHLAVRISSTLDLTLVLVLVQELLLQSLLKVTTPLGDVLEDVNFNWFMFSITFYTI